MKIGIVGYGILGQAIDSALKDTYETIIIDPPKGFYGAIEGCDKFILCLPTPENANGSCDTSLVESYIKRLRGKDILLKSTVDPTILKALEESYEYTYSPEFLREESSLDDFKHQELAIFAGPKRIEWYNILDEAGVYMNEVRFTDIQTAAYVKYTINTFLANKVIFFNELEALFDGDFKELISLVSLDKRIGLSHMQVPGPDGKRGFGGMCFPKDTKAFVYHANKKDTPLKLLEKTIELNKDIR